MVLPPFIRSRTAVRAGDLSDPRVCDFNILTRIRIPSKNRVLYLGICRHPWGRCWCFDGGTSDSQTRRNLRRKSTAGHHTSIPKCQRGSARVSVTRSHRPCTVAASLTVRVTKTSHRAARPSNPKCKRGSARVIVMRSHRPCTNASSLTVRVTKPSHRAAGPVTRSVNEEALE